MKQIYKYTLESEQTQIIRIPSNKVLSVKSQGLKMVTYALVDSENQELLDYEFLIYGTGHNINVDIEQFNFLDTVAMDGGALMFHVFYRKSYCKK